MPFDRFYARPRPSAARLAAWLCSAVLPCWAAHAGEPLAPFIYFMPNGHGVASGGSYNYWDLGYNGLGDKTTDNATLYNGRGDLLDGVVATQNWNLTENIDGSGPYVGWRRNVLPDGPKIYFHFPYHSNVDSVAVHFDDSQGYGGVDLPATVTVGWVGGQATFDVVDPDAGSGPVWLEFGGLTALNTPWVWVGFSYRNEWVFMDEVRFTGATAVPEPAHWALMLAGLGGLAGLRMARQGGG